MSVTVIATGFDRPKSAHRSQAAGASESSAPSAPMFEREDKPSFDVDEDVLDIPSFLKDS